MTTYQYKTVAAPRKLKRVKGVKGADALAAHHVEEAIAVEAADGWEYVRTDRFPIEEKNGMFSRPQVSERAVMIFRKEIVQQVAMAAQPVQPASQPVQPAPQPAPPPQQPAPAPQAAQPQPQPMPQPTRHEPGFSVAGVEPAPRMPPIGGAND